VINGTSGSGSLMPPPVAKAWARSDIFFQVLRMMSSHFSSLYSACLAGETEHVVLDENEVGDVLHHLRVGIHLELALADRH
jgi:hypothetical protein